MSRSQVSKTSPAQLSSPVTTGNRRAALAAGSPVELRPVDEDVLERLVAVAVADSAPGEVTPPLTPGSAWTAERVDWLRAFHRERRAGRSGPHREATWCALAAVVEEARSWGAVELRADTTGGNRSALAVLRAAGFVLDAADAGAVVARLVLAPTGGGDDGRRPNRYPAGRGPSNGWAAGGFRWPSCQGSCPAESGHTSCSASTEP